MYTDSRLVTALVEKRGILKKRDKQGLHECSTGNFQKSSFCYFLPYIIFCMYTQDTYSYVYGKYHYSIKKIFTRVKLTKGQKPKQRICILHLSYISKLNYNDHRKYHFYLQSYSQIENLT